MSDQFTKVLHENRIISRQRARIKSIYPGMIIQFKYTIKNPNKKVQGDPRPLILVIYNEAVYGGALYDPLIHGMNLNYLTDSEIDLLFSKIGKGAGIYSDEQNIPEVLDQDAKGPEGDYDDTLPNRNLLKSPYTQVDVPTYKRERDGNPLSKSEARLQMKMLYNKILKPFLHQKKQVYRTYDIERMMSTFAIEFNTTS